VLDVIDQAVELAIQSGSKVEHVAYAKEGLKRLGGMASILRFK
jgi:peptide subunit release factor 1 (eRF1)